MAKDHDLILPAPLRRGGYVARFAAGAADLEAAQRLRHLCFVDAAGRAPMPGGIEADGFDAQCDHVIVQDADGRVVCCFRLLAFANGGEVNTSYAAQYYDLKRLFVFKAPMLELGRFCVHPDVTNADVLRIAWGMLAAFVDARGAGMLFGCSSFAGTDATKYTQAFNLLAARHLAPTEYAPTIKAAQVVRFGDAAMPVTDHRAALMQVPSLLKTYLTMGGWVSDHAVVDHDMNTLHVFTGLEIARIPSARAAALRAV